MRVWRTVFVWVLGTLWLTLVFGQPGEYDVQDPGQFLNSFLIRVSSREVAEQVARDHGFELIEKLPEIDFYHLSHTEVEGRSKRSAEDFVNRLKDDNRVSFAEQQITLKRVKRTHLVLHDKQLELPIKKIEDNSKYYRVKPTLDQRGNDELKFNDRYVTDAWYLYNTGQTGGEPSFDLDVREAWQKGFTGKGVVVTILDDGIDHSHPDLRKNYDERASADFNDENDPDDDPEPDTTNPGNSHGTRCAGEIAAEANNGICSVGVAYDCNIGGIRLLDGRVTDRLEAKALIFELNYIDLYSASWGPRDDGCTFEGLKEASIAALKVGVTKGRNGLGNIYVWATGNGGDNCDHCGADGYVSSIYSISIQAMSPTGKLPYFGERCSSTMAGVPSGGEPTRQQEIKGLENIKVITTDVNGGCIENFEGTSSAAPLGCGCLALLLQAAPFLHWRDVQHIVALYARIPGIDDGWVINGARYHVNHKFGFGVLDCSAMIDGAQNWTSKPEQHICETETITVESSIPRSGCYKVTIEFDGCEGEENSITHLEHVEVQLEIEAPRRGDVEIFLTSPAGTRSELLGRRCNDDSEEGIDFTFMTVHSWMENPKGIWSLEVCNNPGDPESHRLKPGNKGHPSANRGKAPGGRNTAGIVKKFKLITYGYFSYEENIMEKSYSPNDSSIDDLVRKELLHSRQVDLKRASPNIEKKKEQKGNTESKKQHGDKSDQTLEDLQELFDGIAGAFGANSAEKKKKERMNPMRSSYEKDIHSRGRVEDEGNTAWKDTQMEAAVDEILSEMSGREASTKSLQEILKRKAEQLRRERLRRRMITQLQRILQERKA